MYLPYLTVEFGIRLSISDHYSPKNLYSNILEILIHFIKRESRKTVCNRSTAFLMRLYDTYIWLADTWWKFMLTYDKKLFWLISILFLLYFAFDKCKWNGWKKVLSQKVFIMVLSISLLFGIITIFNNYLCATKISWW